jgi:hypothetical protein
MMKDRNKIEGGRGAAISFDDEWTRILFGEYG